MQKTLLPSLLIGLIAAAVFAQQKADAPKPPAQPEPPRKGESFDPPFEIKSPPAPYLAPDDALKSFKLPRGFKIELVAAEPQIEVPVAMAFDQKGRIWVVEMRSYMPALSAAGENEAISRIIVLEDTDADGRYEKSTVFMDKLVNPRAIATYNGGVLIGAPPNVLFVKDANDDLVPDSVETVFTGYGGNPNGNPEHKENGLMLAIDNWLYNAKSSKRFKFADGKWIEGPTATRGQWGIAQDDFGRLYHNTNSDVLRMDVTPAEYLSRNSNFTGASGASVSPGKDQTVWPSRVNYGVNRGYRAGQLRPDGTLRTVTATCGPLVYRGDLFPFEYRGNAFICEPAGNCVMRKEISEKDLVPASKNPHGQSEFLTSTDERFRPVNLYNGPDGALYVVDIYHGILQHKTYVTPYLGKQVIERGLDKENRKGRIWRIMPEGAKTPPRPDLAKADTATLVAALTHANGWHRDTAQRLLIEKNDASAVPPLTKLLVGDGALAKLHALWSLHGLAKLTPDHVIKALADKEPRVRATAIRVAELLLPADLKDNNGELFDEILALADDPALEVQLQHACTVAGLNRPDAQAATLKIVKKNLAHPYIRDAAIAGLRGRELEFAQQLLADGDFAKAPAKEQNALLAALARCVATEAKASRVARLLAAAAALKSPAQQEAIAGGLAGDPAKKVRKPIQMDAEPAALVALRGSADAKVKAAATRLAEAIIWPGKPGYREIKITPLTPQQQAMFEKGRTLYGQTCSACHQPNGQGQAGLAPPLTDSEWVEGSEGRLIRIVLHGLRGPITVNGTKYDELEMPALEAVFEDEAIASLLTYIRREWEHDADPISAAAVKRVREETKGREGQWTAGELMKVK